MTAEPVRRLDDNLDLHGEEVRCRRCCAPVGTATAWLEHALVRERSAQQGGSLLKAAPELFVDAPVVHRQAFCPGCLTLLMTEVVAHAHRGTRTKRIAPGSST